MKANDPINPDEIAASLTGRARTDALHALRVLSESAESPAGDEEVPPLPAPLREQWQETYGATAPAPVRPAVETREGWLSRLAGIFGRPRVAWAGGLAAAAAAIVLMMPSPETVTTDPGRVVTRGGGHGEVNGTAARLIVVAPADKAAALMAELARAFPARRIERVDAVPANGEGGAVIIDAAARTIRRGGGAGAALKEGDPLTDPAGVIMAIESLDEPEPR